MKGWKWGLLIICVLSLSLLLFPQGSQAKESVNFVFASGYAKNHVQMGVLAELWMKRISEATQGRVRIRGVHGGTLLKSTEVLDGVMRGTADMGAHVIGITPGKLPLSASLSATIDLNLGNKLDMPGIAGIELKLLEEFPAFKKEYESLGLTPLLWVPTVPYGLISTSPIRTFEDLKGKKIRTFGKYLPQLFNAADGVPMAVSFGEVYTSLQTGVIDAACTDPPAMFTAGRFHEVAKYVTLTGPKMGAACALCPVVYFINNKSFQRLSAEDQATIKRVSKEMTLYGANLMTETGTKAVADLKKEGAEIIHLTQADVDKWAEKCPDWYQNAATNLNKLGLPGSEIMARYQELANQYVSGKWKPW